MQPKNAMLRKLLYNLDKSAMVGCFYTILLVHMRILSLSIAALLLLSACSGSLIRLSMQDPQANDYSSSLAAEYLAYAQSEAEQGHFLAAEYFAGKGQRALKGEKVEPEMPAASLAPVLRDELTKARGDLALLQTEDIKRVAPQKAARAQLLYDCWGRQKSELAMQQAPCGDEFRSTLTEIQMIADSFTYGNESSHLIRFAAKSSRLEDEAKIALDEIIDKLGPAANYKIDIHARTNGKKNSLAIKRAQAIRNYFLAKTIADTHIKIIVENESKAVHLSSDEDLPDANTIQLIVRIFTGS